MFLYVAIENGIINQVGNGSIIGVEIFECENCTSILSIPSQVDGYPVLRISMIAFAEQSITELTLPNTLQRINLFAFSGNQLTNVVIPESVTYIGSGAFGENPLEKVTIINFSSKTNEQQVALVGHGQFNYSGDIYSSVE